jgi:hypothetical protein
MQSSAILPIYSRSWRDVLAAASPDEIRAAIDELRLKIPCGNALDKLLATAERQRIFRLDDLATVPMSDELRARLANVESRVRERVARQCRSEELIESAITVIHRTPNGKLSFDIRPPSTWDGDFDEIFEDAVRSHRRSCFE